VAQAIKGIPRETLFIVTKVLPSNASAGHIKAWRAIAQAIWRHDHVDVF